ncbi:MAG: alpha-glucosidase [Terriglobales bacterium]
MPRVSKPGRPKPGVPSALGRWGGRTKPGDAYRPALLAVVVFAAALLAMPGWARAAAAPPAPWWRHAVIYEIYPRSFADSNNDGTGDLRGIATHLDYLQALGVNAIWITPFYPSPQVDFGYDISNYRAIDPRYGTLADFDALLRAAHRRHIKVLLDMVLNHTSDRHPWFQASRSSRQSPYRDFYIWRDGKNGGPPNNWTSLFGGSAWQYDARTGQYYYHFFYRQQPDLNWRNPAVEKAMFANVRFWLQRGVDGFRLDAVTTLFEDPKLRDNPPGLIHTGDFGPPQQKHVYNQGLPEVNGVLKRLRRLADQYHAVLIGETVGQTEARLAEYYGHGEEIQLPFDFLFADVNRLSAPAFRHRIAAWVHNPAHGTPDWFFDNHDQRREIDRYGDGVHDAQIARLLPTMLLTLPGTAILYYGQEIGMVTTDPTSEDQVRDPIGRRWWPKYKGRDGERTPMQWSAGPDAGFCASCRPWLPIPASAARVNVAAEEKQPESLLSYYRRLIHLRDAEPALVSGDWAELDAQDPNVLIYRRRTAGETVLVALNMSAAPRTEHLASAAADGQVLIDSRGRAGALALSDLRLEPYESVVLRLKR